MSRIFASGVTGAWDPHGNQMGAPHTWWFATKATTPFTVTATNPEAGAVGVPLTAPLVITFNKELLAGSEELVSFRLDLLQGSYEPVMVPGQVERQGRSLRFMPDEPLEEGAIYQARVLGAHQAPSGKAILDERIDTPYRWAFEVDSFNPPILSPSESLSDASCLCHIVVGTAHLPWKRRSGAR